MDIERRVREAAGLTPTEQQLAATILKLGERLQGYSIKELAKLSSTSIASIHRLCKKLGLEGFKQLKVEMARSTAMQAANGTRPVDINFPFSDGDRAREVMPSMASLYETTIRDTVALLDEAQLDRAARLIAAAEQVELYTGSHNLYPAQMFEERLLSAGKRVLCPTTSERQVRIALASEPANVAIFISYSGLSPYVKTCAGILREQKVPMILIGSRQARRIHPGLDAYLLVSDREDLQSRITQFASHLAVQFVLDALYGCAFARDYQRDMAFLAASIPYTARRGMDEMARAGGAGTGAGAVSGVNTGAGVGAGAGSISTVNAGAKRIPNGRLDAGRPSKAGDRSSAFATESNPLDIAYARLQHER